MPYIEVEFAKDRRSLLLLAAHLVAFSVIPGALILPGYGNDMSLEPDHQVYIAIYSVLVASGSIYLYLKTGLPNVVLKQCSSCGEMTNPGRLRCSSCGEDVALDDGDIGAQLLWFMFGYSLMLSYPWVLLGLTVGLIYNTESLHQLYKNPESLLYAPLILVVPLLLILGIAYFGYTVPLLLSLIVSSITLFLVLVVSRTLARKLEDSTVS